jgi:hypothetical protein
MTTGIDASVWEGYMGPEGPEWWGFKWIDDASGKWWSMSGLDGMEAVAIPAERWTKYDSQLIGQLLLLFARRRLAYHKMCITVDPMLIKRPEPLGYWEEIVENKEVIEDV